PPSGTARAGAAGVPRPVRLLPVRRAAARGGETPAGALGSLAHSAWLAPARGPPGAVAGARPARSPRPGVRPTHRRGTPSPPIAGQSSPAAPAPRASAARAPPTPPTPASAA